MLPALVLVAIGLVIPFTLSNPMPLLFDPASESIYGGQVRHTCRCGTG
ncbi:MAG: hypothetical protein R2873_19430 [Caldilineaceae bacterium]